MKLKLTKRYTTIAATALAVCAALWLVSYVQGARLRAAPFASLESALATAKTGDLIVFKSRIGSWYSLLSRSLSPATHVGMVVRESDTVNIVESHARGDTRHLGVITGGPHTYPLGQRAATYDGTVYMCQLAVPLSEQQEKDLREALLFLMPVPYDTKPTSHYIKKCLLTRNPPAPPRDAMFCSEFLATALVRAGLLPPDTDTQCVTPSSLLDAKDSTGHPLFTNLVRLT